MGMNELQMVTAIDPLLIQIFQLRVQIPEDREFYLHFALFIWLTTESVTLMPVIEIKNRTLFIY